MANFIMGMISLTISIIMLSGVVMPAVITANKTYACDGVTPGVKNATCPWGAGEIALWGLISLCCIAGLVYGALNIFGLA
jgi:hypothetical protein